MKRDLHLKCNLPQRSGIADCSRDGVARQHQRLRTRHPPSSDHPLLLWIWDDMGASLLVCQREDKILSGPLHIPAGGQNGAIPPGVKQLATNLIRFMKLGKMLRDLSPWRTTGASADPANSPPVPGSIDNEPVDKDLQII